MNNQCYACNDQEKRCRSCGNTGRNFLGNPCICGQPLSEPNVGDKVKLVVPPKCEPTITIKKALWDEMLSYKKNIGILNNESYFNIKKIANLEINFQKMLESIKELQKEGMPNCPECSKKINLNFDQGYIKNRDNGYVFCSIECAKYYREKS